MALWLTIVLVCVALLLAALLIRRRRRRREDFPPPALQPPTLRRMGVLPPLELPSVAPGDDGEPGRADTAALEASPNGPSAAVPPDPRRGWAAEIEWRDTGRRPFFGVVARDATGHGEVVLASSPPLEWPPVGPPGVQALTDAVEKLEFSLADAGWTPLPAGATWYAKRFQWEPRAAADEPRRTGRFARAPEGDGAWLCEIELNANASGSRFQAAVLSPEGWRSVIAESPLVAARGESGPDEPDSACRSKVQRLAAALEEAGWEAQAPGSQWYALRFAWPREGEPPARLAVKAPKAENSP